MVLVKEFNKVKNNVSLIVDSFMYSKFGGVKESSLKTIDRSLFLSKEYVLLRSLQLLLFFPLLEHEIIKVQNPTALIVKNSILFIYILPI